MALTTPTTTTKIVECNGVWLKEIALERFDQFIYEKFLYRCRCNLITGSTDQELQGPKCIIFY